MKRYPLIVHLENHCSVPQQRLAARILRDSIGPALLRTSTDDDSKPLTLRSPEELVGKVIISVRKKSILKLRIDPDFKDRFLLLIGQEIGIRRGRRRSDWWRWRSRNEPDAPVWKERRRSRPLEATPRLSRALRLDRLEPGQQHQAAELSW